MESFESIILKLKNGRIMMIWPFSNLIPVNAHKAF